MNTDKPPPSSTGQSVQIAWEAVKQRLDAAITAVAQTTSPDQAETRRILKARALALGQTSKHRGDVDESIEVVTFMLAQERYAIELRYVRDVYPLEQLTPVPCTPAFVLGIVNLRGEILSVIDIKKFFDLPDKGLTDLNKVIVLDTDGMRFGIVADAILGVHAIATASLQASLPTLTGIREEYLKGVTPDRTVILDAGKLLADERIIVQEQVAG